MTENTYNICDNVKRVQEEIYEACIKYGRSPSNIQLMGVSKTQSTEKLQQAYESGIQLFGENRVQELIEKSDFFLKNNLPCHIIGQLQTNKVKYLPKLTDTIQSVDSLKLSAEINKQYSKNGITANILLEVNIGEEISKAGFNKHELIEAVYKISEHKNIKIKGLMCIPPICQGENVREYFYQMNKLFVDISDKKIDNVDMHTLSMGMSHDYKWAIAEGSTLVRVGRGIFGERNYKKI